MKGDNLKTMDKNKKILSIQDISCFGQCSLTVALPILSALGIETAVIPTAVLSTHTGPMFPNFTFHDLTSEIPLIKNHWKNCGIYFDAVYSGYLGRREQIKYVLELFNSCGQKGSKLFADPVMGDSGKFYSGFDESFAKLMKSYCSYADVITPNITEAHFLLENKNFRSFYSKDEIDYMTRSLVCRKNQKVIITGIPHNEKTICISLYDSENDNLNIIEQELIQGTYHGTGDIFASVCFGLLLKDKSLEFSVLKASEFVLNAIKNTPDNKTHNYGVHFESCLEKLCGI